MNSAIHTRATAIASRRYEAKAPTPPPPRSSHRESRRCAASAGHRSSRQRRCGRTADAKGCVLTRSWAKSFRIEAEAAQSGRLDLPHAPSFSRASVDVAQEMQSAVHGEQG